MRAARTVATTCSRRLRRASTEAEQRLWSRLRDRRLAGIKFARQEPIGPYFANFACRSARLVVKVDGHQHAESAHDRVRDAFLAERGYRVPRFWNAEVVTNVEGVLGTIRAALLASPRRRGEAAEVGPSDPAVPGVSPEGGGEGASQDEAPPGRPPHPRLPPCRADTPGQGPSGVVAALSPRAGRGE